jgi:hypothetical protein
MTAMPASFEDPDTIKIEVKRYDVESGRKVKPVEVLTAERKKVFFRVDGIPVQADLKGGLTVIFGGQRITSDKLNNAWIPMNDNYGFSDLLTVDFDQDGISDAVVTFTWGGWGSGWGIGHICVSSKTRKAYIYETFSGNNYWHNNGYNFPVIQRPFCILEIPDWMPDFSVKAAGDSVSHSDQVSFIFTQVWDGDGFSNKPVIEFYKKLLPEVKEFLVKERAEKYPEPVKLAFYKLIIEEYRKAAQGLPISKETKKTSSWRLLKAFNPEPK